MRASGDRSKKHFVTGVNTCQSEVQNITVPGNKQVWRDWSPGDRGEKSFVAGGKTRRY
jgi:hypothetical protein